YYLGDDPSDLETANKYEQLRASGYKVGLRLPNPFGLYDMCGNAQEWCLNWYYEYPKTLQFDPLGPPLETRHVLRGVDFRNKDKRIAKRYPYQGDTYFMTPGFRIIKEIE
ncbi:SUMF1/EgtB/PvdO family nonheme iron enzyme, partial [bacterium]|nr:SUMF1/EgtB/PvdO family nonheme iron enzyme [bacterium]